MLSIIILRPFGAKKGIGAEKDITNDRATGMRTDTIRLTMAQAVVRYLCAQVTEIGGQRMPLFAGVFGIFGHGNVTCLAEAAGGGSGQAADLAWPE